MRVLDVNKVPSGANDMAWVYNGLDCLITLEIYDTLIGSLVGEPECVRKTYEDTLSKLGPIMQMELTGLRVDEFKRNVSRSQIEKDIDRLKYQLSQLTHAAIGQAINSNSPKQVAYLFYECMDLPRQRSRSANGTYTPTVNIKALNKLKKHFFAEPFVNHILKIRDLTKQLSFVNTGIDPDERFRTSLDPTGTTTGRLASGQSDFGSGKNLQNVDRRLRTSFIPDKGMMFVNIDLEQADSRNVAARCWELFYETHGEEFAGSYLNACESGDLHTSVAKMVWPELEWDTAPDKEIAGQLFYRQDSYRQTAKKYGHASNYLAQAKTVANETNSPLAVVNAFHERYFKAFPCIKEWNNWVIEQVQTKGELTTLFGRRRQFFGRPKDAATHRLAVAYEPQSMTSHEVDIGCLQVWRKFDWCQPLMQVHDSILYQIPINKEDRIPEICEAMLVKLPLKGGREFCIPVEAKVGMNWGDYDKKDNPNGLKEV